MKAWTCLAFTVALAAGGAPPARAPSAARGPLRVHPDNPRYFTDGTKAADGTLNAVYLTGSHTWPNLIDRGESDPPPAFDFDKYLDFLGTHDHNFIRLWSRHVTWYHDYGDDPRVLHAGPLAWPRTGPGDALDGKPKFDLGRFNEAYFERLRARVAAAGDRGVYVSVMLFGGYYECTGGWRGNPFNAANNVNGINGDVDGDGRGLESHTLDAPAAVTRLQEAYVRKVVDTVNDLDNVLYEISNESHTSSKDWQYHLVRYLREYEQGKPKQHPVGMTALWGDDPAADNRALYAGEADWVSPQVNDAEIRKGLLPAADGRKVSLLDSDHWFIFPILNDPALGRDWVWQAFSLGHNPILMEQVPINSGSNVPVTTEDPGHVASRRAMGHTRRLADRMNLVAMTPRPALASTGYCLAAPGVEYLAYQPKAGEAFTVELVAGVYELTWIDPAVEDATDAGGDKRRRVESAGGVERFQPPFDGPAVLHLKRAASAAR
jgi:hypothetical protein